MLISTATILLRFCFVLRALWCMTTSWEDTDKYISGRFLQLFHHKCSINNEIPFYSQTKSSLTTIVSTPLYNKIPSHHPFIQQNAQSRHTPSYNKMPSHYPFIQQNSQSVPFHTTKCPVSTPSYNKMPSQYPFIQENDQSVPLHTRK